MVFSQMVFLCDVDIGKKHNTVKIFVKTKFSSHERYVDIEFLTMRRTGATTLKKKLIFKRRYIEDDVHKCRKIL